MRSLFWFRVSSLPWVHTQFTVLLEQDSKTLVFPRNFTQPAPPRYIHFQNALHCTFASNLKNTCFPRENRTFSILAPRSTTQ